MPLQSSVVGCAIAMKKFVVEFRYCAVALAIAGGALGVDILGCLHAIMPWVFQSSAPFACALLAGITTH